jgi:energy-coupling factor transporter transmembrane protein EcfT
MTQRLDQDESGPGSGKEEHLATRRGLKRYGLLSGVIALGVVFVSAGMPGHFLWPWVGVPLIIMFACAFTPVLFYGGRFLWEWMESIGK